MNTKAMEVRDATRPRLVAAEPRDVPMGYKHTDAGVIPVSWQALPITRIVRNIIDFRGRTPRKLGMEWGGGDIPALSARNVRMGFLDLNEETHYGSVALYERWMTNGEPEKGDVAFTTEAPLGNVAIIPDDRRYMLSQRTILLQPEKDAVTGPFLFYILSSDAFQRKLSEHATGSTASGIQRRTFEKLQVPMPPTPEQRAIAEALSDVDGLLGGLDALIAKKRAIKKAAVQELLTGKVRLPGFRGTWEKSSLKRFVQEFIVPMRDKPNRLTGHIPWCRIEDFDGIYLAASKSGQGVDLRTVQEMNLKVYPTGTLLVSCSADLGRCAIAERPLVSNQTFIGLVMRESVSSNLYFYYYMTVHSEELNNLSSGTTISYLSRERFEELPVLVPTDPLEQGAIAAVLFDIDLDIEALKRRRKKTLAIKQGMMQQLLTGRVRLVKPVSAEASA
jgi:type I restriction enzyme S subunit